MNFGKNLLRFNFFKGDPLVAKMTNRIYAHIYSKYSFNLMDGSLETVTLSEVMY